MNKLFTAKKLCRAGVIAALYVALTYVFMPFAYGPLQIRPAEALCILPLFFPEAVPALYVACMLANIPSGPIDVFLGSFATLLAALGTYSIGRFFKNKWLKLILGGIFPVVLNALIIPLIIVFIYKDFSGYSNASLAYFTYVFSIGFTQLVWVYGLGAPLYLTLWKHKARLK